MFDIGFWEITVIAVIALLVVGPDEFPQLVRSVGQFMGKARDMLSSVKGDFDREMDKADKLKELAVKEADIAKIHQMLADTQSSVSAVTQGFNEKSIPMSAVRPAAEKKKVDAVADSGDKKTVSKITTVSKTTKEDGAADDGTQT